MWYKIKQGKHRASPLSLGIHFGKTSESYEVIFDDSCRYQLDKENQLDWNKGKGWSYGILPNLEALPLKFIPAHHNNSIRWVWRYNKESDKVEISLYIYEDGKRVDTDSTEVISVPLDTKVIIDLFKRPLGYGMLVRNYGNAVYRTYSEINPKWGYNLGVYFGGTFPAPKDLRVWIKKV